jgi:hypothetical protein
LQTSPDPTDSSLAVWDAWSAHLERRRLSGEPNVIRFDDACKAHFVRLLTDVNERIARMPHDPMIPALLRAVNSVQVIAGLYAFSRGETLATDDDGVRALRLMRHIVEMAREVSTHWDVGPVASQEQQVLDALRDAGEEGLPKSALYRVIRVKADLDLVLERLVEQDLVEAIQVRTARRPKTVYRLADLKSSGGVVIPLRSRNLALGDSEADE